MGSSGCAGLIWRTGTRRRNRGFEALEVGLPLRVPMDSLTKRRSLIPTVTVTYFEPSTTTPSISAEPQGRKFE